MKRLTLIAACAAAVVTAQAQQKLEREECLKYAFIVTANLKEMLNTPIPTDPDVKRPVAFKEEDHGAMVLPEAKLTAETFAKAGKAVTPVGQLWMVKLAPVKGEQVVPVAKLRQLHLSSGDEQADAVCCALGLGKTGDGGLELLIYGQGAEPVVRVPVKSISGGPQENPIEMSAERKGDDGTITLRFVGKYEATFTVRDPEK